MTVTRQSIRCHPWRYLVGGLVVGVMVATALVFVNDDPDHLRILGTGWVEGAVFLTIIVEVFGVRVGAVIVRTVQGHARLFALLNTPWVAGRAISRLMSRLVGAIRAATGRGTSSDK